MSVKSSNESQDESLSAVQMRFLAATGSATVLNFTSPKNTGNFSKANTHDL
jgi:hypothetical protein